MKNDIVSWFNSQPAWMREAVEIYVKNGVIADNKINELADICISEAKGEDCSKYKVSSTNLLSLGNNDSFAIESISDIKGVNAIDSNKPMNFATKGINVIYGANGTGKSGYIRILKMVSGATYREEIKPNIYKSKSTKPECIITLSKNDKESSKYKCDLRIPGEYPIMSKIDIFDTKTAQGYVNEEKEASFEPWIFGLFSSLGETAQKIKSELNYRKDVVTFDSYNIPPTIANTDIIKNLENINYKSVPEKIIKDFSQNDEKLLTELKNKSQVENNKLNICLKKEQIKNLKEVYSYFKQFEVFYSNDHFSNIQSLCEDWISKANAYKLSQELLEKNIDEIDKQSLTIESWKELWKSARNLFEEIKTESSIDYSLEGGRCPLCHQTITKEYANRMKTIDEYVNGATSILAQQSKEKYKKSLYHSQTKLNSELISKIDVFKNEFENLINNTNNILVKNKTEIDRFTDKPISIDFVDINTILNKIQERINELSNNISELEKLNEDEDQKKILEEISLLESIKCIKANESKIRSNIDNLKIEHIINEAMKKTSTNKLTFKSKELAKELITDAYINRFNEELKKLSANGLTASVVEGKARIGKNPYKIQLRDANGGLVSPKDILSEGESRAISLAAFFAEATGRTETSPLVIDDPISSLDYDYETRVISRIVEVAKSRQIIVFTHRVSVVVGISELIEDKSLFNELSLNATKDRKGIPGNPDVNASKSDKALNRLISENLAKLKRMDELDEDYLREKHYICQQFRNCVEKSVEEYLIGEVVMRFRRDVQTRKIRHLPSITEADCQVVDSMMTKYSAYDHSMSSETPLIEFDVSDIESDMTSFAQWLAIRKRLINSQPI